MRFFSNSHINRLYVHSGFQGLAQNCGGVFVYSYFLKAGLGLPVVMALAAGMVLVRIGLRLLVVPLVYRLGLRRAVMLGGLLESCGYLVLPLVKGVDVWLFAYLAMAATGTTFYWMCYHALVARLGDAAHRGSQVSAREAIFALTAIVGPLIGGIALTVSGPFAAFGLAFACGLLGLVPLLGMDPSPVEPDAKLVEGAWFFASALAFCDGLVAMSVNQGWRLLLFQTMGSNFENLGRALAAAGLVGATMGLGGGRLIDLGHHRRSLQLSLLAVALVIGVEIFGHATAWLAIGATMATAVALPLYMSSIMPPFYNQGQNSGCSLRFNVAGENGFDLGFGSALALAGGLIALGASPGLPLSFGLLGCAGIYLVLRGRNQHGVVVTAAAQ